jgi:adenine-specific DNA methylase
VLGAASTGGGALHLEPQRLGLEAYASGLNPVAVLINKAMIGIGQDQGLQPSPLALLPIALTTPVCGRESKRHIAQAFC